MKQVQRTLIFALAGVLLALAFVSCSKPEKKVVGSCGGYNILYEELRFETLTYRSQHPDCTEEELEAGVKAALCKTYALLSLCAEHMPERDPDGKELKKLTDQALAEAISSLGGKKEYQKYLQESYLTDHLMRSILTSAQLQLELEGKLFKGTELENTDTLLAWLDDGNYARVRKIYFPLTDASGNSMRAKADIFRTQIANGGKPDELLSPDQKAAGAKCYSAGYYFKWMENSALERAALSLSKAGDVSDVITEEDGYYLLLRVENDRETMVTYQLPTLLNTYRADRIAVLIDQVAAEMTVEWNDYGKELSLKDMD